MHALYVYMLGPQGPHAGPPGAQHWGPRGPALHTGGPRAPMLGPPRGPALKNINVSMPFSFFLGFFPVCFPDFPDFWDQVGGRLGSGWEQVGMSLR